MQERTLCKKMIIDVMGHTKYLIVGLIFCECIIKRLYSSICNNSYQRILEGLNVRFLYFTLDWLFYSVDFLYPILFPKLFRHN